MMDGRFLAGSLLLLAAALGIAPPGRAAQPDTGGIVTAKAKYHNLYLTTWTGDVLQVRLERRS